MWLKLADIKTFGMFFLWILALGFVLCLCVCVCVCVWCVCVCVCVCVLCVCVCVCVCVCGFVKYVLYACVTTSKYSYRGLINSKSNTQIHRHFIKSYC